MGGVLLGLIEIVPLPTQPVYSTLLQLLPLAFLLGGLWFLISQYQELRIQSDERSVRLRGLMTAGWFAVFGVDAGVASINNMATTIFHTQLPYYYLGVSLAQKVIALTGIFVLGIVSVLVLEKQHRLGNVPGTASDFWENPLTNIGFTSLLLGVVFGLAQYWSTIVFAGFLLLLAGVLLYPVGRLTEKNIQVPDDEN